MWVVPSPPSTLMTGTTTQVMLDIADVPHDLDGEIHSTTKAHIRILAIAIVTFAAVCGVAAVLYSLCASGAFSCRPSSRCEHSPSRHAI
jgi:hypothetical protein